MQAVDNVQMNLTAWEKKCATETNGKSATI